MLARMGRMMGVAWGSESRVGEVGRRWPRPSGESLLKMFPFAAKV